MKKLILLLVLFISFSSFEAEKSSSPDISMYTGYVVFTNHTFDPIDIVFYVEANSYWKVIGTSHIPGGFAVSLPIGNAHHSQYAFTTNRDKSLRIIWSTEIDLY